MNKQKLIDEVIDLINHNKLLEASKILNQLNLQYPNDTEILHFFGILNYKNMNFDLAIEYFNAAIKINPNNYLSLNALGLIYFEKGNLDLSLKYYFNALKIKPDFPETYFNIANVCIFKNDYLSAIDYLKKALLHKPNPDYFKNILLCFDNLKNISENISYIDENIQFYSNNYEIMFNLSTICYNQELYDKAYIYGYQAYKLNPKSLNLLINLILICGKLGKYDEAIKYGLLAIELDKFNDVIYNNLGYTYFLNKNYELSEKFLNIAIKINPKNYLAYFNLGSVYREEGEYEKAISYFQECLKYNPDYYEALNNIGIIYNHLNKYKEALEIFEELAPKMPDSSEVMMNLGNTYQYNKLFTKSLQTYFKSIELKPSNASAHKNLAISYFLINRYDLAYEEYEWRFLSDNIKFVYSDILKYNGELLNGKTVAFHFEQGLGDTIQFVRYIKVFKELFDCKTILICQKPLYNLFKPLNFIDETYFINDNFDVKVDYFIPLLSVMKYLKISPTNYYNNNKYIFIDEKNVKRFKNYIKENGKLNIGITWAGNPKHKNNHNRSIDINKFMQIFDGIIDKFNIYALSPEIDDYQRQILNYYNIEHIGKEFKDFLDTASFIENLNIIISVDTSVAHLSGALGKTIFMLLPYLPDWRWGAEGENNFWYSSMQIFIQEKPGEWEEPFLKIRNILNNLG